jgi:hypothetical protein
VRFLEVIAPGGFAQYFRELAPLIRPGGLPDLAAVMVLPLAILSGLWFLFCFSVFAFDMWVKALGG